MVQSHQMNRRSGTGHKRHADHLNRMHRDVELVERFSPTALFPTSTSAVVTPTKPTTTSAAAVTPTVTKATKSSITAAATSTTPAAVPTTTKAVQTTTTPVAPTTTSTTPTTTSSSTVTTSSSTSSLPTSVVSSTSATSVFQIPAATTSLETAVYTTATASLASSSATSTSTSTSGGISTGAIVGGIAAGLVAVAACIFMVFYFIRRWKRKGLEGETDWDPDAVRRQSAILLDDDQFNPAAGVGMGAGAGAMGAGRWNAGANPRPPTMIERKLANSPATMAGRGAFGQQPAWAGDYASNGQGYGVQQSFEPGQIVRSNTSSGHGHGQGSGGEEQYAPMDRGASPPTAYNQEQYGEMSRRLSGPLPSPFDDPSAPGLNPPAPAMHAYHANGTPSYDFPSSVRPSPMDSSFALSPHAQAQHISPHEALDSAFVPSAYEHSPMGPGAKVAKPGPAVVGEGRTSAEGKRPDTVYDDGDVYGGF